MYWPNVLIIRREPYLINDYLWFESIREFHFGGGQTTLYIADMSSGEYMTTYWIFEYVKLAFRTRCGSRYNEYPNVPNIHFPLCTEQFLLRKASKY